MSRDTLPRTLYSCRSKFLDLGAFIVPFGAICLTIPILVSQFDLFHLRGKKDDKKGPADGDNSSK